MTAAIAVLILLTTAAQAHDSWISRGGLKNQVGERCGGAYDCKELDYTPKPVDGGILLKSGEIVPQAEVMPVSPEGYVVCRRPDGTRRCVFAPSNGS